MERIITIDYLRKNPNHIFVYGDNILHKGKKGAAALSGESNTYGLVTKKYPRGDNDAFYKCSEYEAIFKKEIDKLVEKILANPDKIFLISKVGAGLANRFKIFEKIIEPNIKNILSKYSNVVFLW